MKMTTAKKSKPFGGIDGESFTDADTGEHRYVLLMDSEGESVFAAEGLSTKACLDFVLGRPRNRIWCAFGLNYDVNMMLRDLSPTRLRELWVTGETRFFNFQLEWIPGKWFQVTDLKSVTAYRNRNGKTVARFTRQTKINEVFGFFQTSFLKALEKWNIGTQDADMIEAMKLGRSSFTPELLQAIRDYCHTECVLLTELMESVRSALVSVDIHCSSWNGAGSVAAAIFKRENVKAHIQSTEAIQNEVLTAYYGGRTELYTLGKLGAVWQYDIVSAYPYAATYLPSLQGTWHYTDSPDTIMAEVYRDRLDARHGLTYVLWEVNAGTVVPPFPHRSKGRITYPLAGRGWYHNIEVQAALDIFGPDQIRPMACWRYQSSNADRPFSFVHALAEQKVRYKREGHAGEKVLKLGINSLYGKLAQGRGYKDTIPPYQCYFWAGYITAHCRSRMLTLAHKAGERNVAMIATDGIFFTSDPEFDNGDTFGGLEKNVISDMFTVQPGVYHGYDDGGREIRKSRGFFAREIDFDSLRTGYEMEGALHVGRYSSTRFVGLGSALSSEARLDNVWRTWQTSERKLVLWPSVRRVEDIDARPVRLMPVCGDGSLSEAYTPKGGYSEDEEEYMQGKDQPLREYL